MNGNHGEFPEYTGILPQYDPPPPLGLEVHLRQPIFQPRGMKGWSDDICSSAQTRVLLLSFRCLSFLETTSHSLHSHNCPQKLGIFLPLPPKRWHCKHVPPHLASHFFYFCTSLSSSHAGIWGKVVYDKTSVECWRWRCGKDIGTRPCIMKLTG